MDIGRVGLNVEEAGIEDLRNVGKELSAAFKEIGFVFVSNHGIEESIITSAREASKEYFKVLLCPKLHCYQFLCSSSTQKSKEAMRKVQDQMSTRGG